MNLLVTGGCGYVGTMLVESLLKKGHKIRVIDTQWFGNYLKPSSNLEILKMDVRDVKIDHVQGINRIVHLANIANDPAVELDQTLSWEVNVLATQQLIETAVEYGEIGQFIYASSGSVYGVKEEEHVTEDLKLVPISAYNKTKMVAERVLRSYTKSIPVHSIRPATVCGLSPRMRLDVAVNILTFQALSTGKITVLGGEQVRPNIHIKDMISVYEHFLDNCDIIENGEYNAGFENISILDNAKMVQELINCEIEIKSSNDPRSYRQNSNKLLKTGFSPKHGVKQAIIDIKQAFESGTLVDSSNFHTIKTMRKILESK